MENGYFVIGLLGLKSGAKRGVQQNWPARWQLSTHSEVRIKVRHMQKNIIEDY